MLLVRPYDPGKYITDLFTKGIEYAIKNNRKEYCECPNIICGGNDNIDLMDIPEKYEFVREDIPTRYHIDLDSGFISELLKSSRYNYKK